MPPARSKRRTSGGRGREKNRDRDRLEAEPSLTSPKSGGSVGTSQNDLGVETESTEDFGGEFWGELDEPQDQDFGDYILDEDEVQEEETALPDFVTKFPEDGSGGDPPQVWIRIRQGSEFDSNVFEIGEDRKKLRILIQPEDRILKKSCGPLTSYTFSTDGILQDSGQDEVFSDTTSELVDKALSGVSGSVIVVGPEQSGKSWTLFGPLKYQSRGVIPRVLEKIFEKISGEDSELRVIFSMFEIRRDKIKDLLTLGPYELTSVGEYGPKGLFYEELSSLEHGLSLLFRGLAGQKKLVREPWAKPHTLIYIDILGGKGKKTTTSNNWRSRLTFAKIAAMPLRAKRVNASPVDNASSKDKNKDCILLTTPTGAKFPCCPKKTPNQTSNVEVSASVPTSNSKSSNCCRPLQGPLAESISIRKDFSQLERMFVGAGELARLADYYYKLQALGMYMLSGPPALAPSQYYRTSRLGYCLKELVGGGSSVRLILAVRPERDFLQNTLEAMRFGARVRCIPNRSGIGKNKNEGSFEENLEQMCKEMGIGSRGNGGHDPSIPPTDPTNEIPFPGSSLSKSKLASVLQQASGLIDQKLDLLDGECKAQLKSLFETFRQTLERYFDGSAETLQDKEEPKAKNQNRAKGKDRDKSKKSRKSTKKDLTEKSGSVQGQEDEESEEVNETEEEQRPKSSNFVGISQDPWAEFIASNSKGAGLFGTFEEIQGALKSRLLEHNEAQVELSALVSKLTALHIQSEDSEQKRGLKTTGVENSSVGNEFAQEIEENKAKEQSLLTNLEELRSQIQVLKKELKAVKHQVETAFGEYCAENSSPLSPTHQKLALSTLDSAVAAASLGFGLSPSPSPSTFERNESDEVEIGGESPGIAKDFELLGKIAKKQVKLLMASAPKRPPWTNY